MIKKNVFEIMKEIYSPKVKLKIRVEKHFIYVEGSKISLEWLSQIIHAYANQDYEDDFWIEPNGAGATYFSRNSKMGLYLFNTDFKSMRHINSDKKVTSMKTKNNSRRKSRSLS